MSDPLTAAFQAMHCIFGYDPWSHDIMSFTAYFIGRLLNNYIIFMNIPQTIDDSKRTGWSYMNNMCGCYLNCTKTANVYNICTYVQCTYVQCTLYVTQLTILRCEVNSCMSVHAHVHTHQVAQFHHFSSSPFYSNDAITLKLALCYSIACFFKDNDKYWNLVQAPRRLMWN